MIIEKLQAAARLLARKRTAASGIPAREHFASDDSSSCNSAAAGCNFAAAGSGTDSTAAGTIIDDQPAWDRPVLRQPASRPTRRKAAIVATPEEAEALIADPSDDVARQALAKAKVRTAKGGKTLARTTARTPGRTRGTSPQRRTAVERLNDPPPASGAVLIERVSRAVERELSQIEIIIGGNRVKPAQRTEAERRARTLASLAKTLSEVMRLRMQDQKVKPADDDVPRDLDEFRRELSRRLEQMVRSREAVSDRGNEAG